MLYAKQSKQALSRNSSYFIHLFIFNIYGDLNLLNLFMVNKYFGKIKKKKEGAQGIRYNDKN